jgi:hypothetical protein
MVKFIDMPQSNRFLKLPFLTSIILLLLGVSVTPPSSQFGSFEITGESTSKKIRFGSEDGNHVFCKQYDNYLWLRFATSSEKDGENSDHLDIDIWNYSGAGVYAPNDPKSSKREGKKWNIWWHKGNKVFVNQADSSPCELIIEKKGEELFGSFGCKTLKLNDGTDLLAIENGEFRVTPVDGNAK